MTGTTTTTTEEDNSKYKLEYIDKFLKSLRDDQIDIIHTFIHSIKHSSNSNSNSSSKIKPVVSKIEFHKEYEVFGNDYLPVIWTHFNSDTLHDIIKESDLDSFDYFETITFNFDEGADIFSVKRIVLYLTNKGYVIEKAQIGDCLRMVKPQEEENKKCHL